MVSTKKTWVKSWKLWANAQNPALWCLGNLRHHLPETQSVSWRIGKQWRLWPCLQASPYLQLDRVWPSGLYLLIWWGAVGSLAGTPRFSTLVTEPSLAAWQAGMVEKLLTDSVGCWSHGLIGPTLSPAVWGKTGNYSCQAKGAVKSSGLVSVLGAGWCHQGHGHICGIMGPQTNVKMPGSDTGQIESWENQEKIKKNK